MIENFLLLLGRFQFAIFGVLALLGGVVMIASRNAVHSVMGFLFAMLATAACYLCLSAEFLAVAQILVYAGGIVVLFLFVVMLVEMEKFKTKWLFQRQWPQALALVVAAALLFLGVFRVIPFGPSAPQALVLRPGLTEKLEVETRDPQGNVVKTQNAQAVSRGLYADHLLPFEILSIILLVALVGAVVIAKPERSEG